MTDSKFVSVLKKIGQSLVKVGEIATEVLGFPFVSQMLGQVKIGGTNLGAIAQTGVADYNTLSGIASIMETAFPASGTGSQKVAAGAPLVQQSVLLWAKSALPGHNKVKDPDKLAAASGRLLGDWADIMNSFGD